MIIGFDKNSGYVAGSVFLVFGFTVGMAGTPATPAADLLGLMPEALIGKFRVNRNRARRRR